jgi:hypothetical protein
MLPQNRTAITHGADRGTEGAIARDPTAGGPA